MSRSNVGACLSHRRATLEHLRSFVAVVEDGGFSNASKNLYRTQSSVTQNLLKLEQIVGCKLIDRKQGRIIGLTSEGERFLPQAKDALEKVSFAISTIKSTQPNGRIRLGIPDDLNCSQVYRHCRMFKEEFPSWSVEVNSSLSESICSMIKADKLDVAIFRSAVLRESMPEMDVKEIFRERIFWTGLEMIDLRKVRELPLVLYSSGCVYNKLVHEALDNEGKRYHLSYSSPSRKNIQSAISAGLGYGVAPKSSIDSNWIVFNTDSGFPELPEMAVLSAVRSQKSIYKTFLDSLVIAVKSGGKFD